ncbi:MAG: glycosyltransferase [Burkholderiales bacterium]|nr:glycosyltransferase [Burkholderiales bacterium]
MITISIVSHGQSALVEQLLADLARLDISMVTEVLVTLNIPETIAFKPRDYPYPVSVLRNTAARGFGANHNAAFRQAKGELFCVVNPDIRLPDNPFSILIEEIARHSAGVIGPMVVTPDGMVEDNVRHFPVLTSLAAKLLGYGDGRYVFTARDKTFAADWVAGMFMLFRARDFRAVGGFDEAFFLYYEDVDICARMWKSGRSVLVCPNVRVIHNAQRSSRRNLRYMKWHALSLARYLCKHWGRLPRTTGQQME